MSKFHLAQVNIARLLAPEGDSRVADFFDNIDRINEIAESSEGFIWRYSGDYDEDPMIVYNASIWESIDALSQFVYRSDHVSIFRQREEWFEAPKKPSMALWWIDATAPPPNFQDAFARLEHLERNGPTDYAFTFRQTFLAP